MARMAPISLDPQHAGPVFLAPTTTRVNPRALPAQPRPTLLSLASPFVLPVQRAPTRPLGSPPAQRVRQAPTRQQAQARATRPCAWPARQGPTRPTLVPSRQLLVLPVQEEPTRQGLASLIPPPATIARQAPTRPPLETGAPFAPLVPQGHTTRGRATW